MAYRMKGFSGFKSSPTKIGTQSPKEALDEANIFDPDKPANKLDGGKTSTQNKHTGASRVSMSESQAEIRENKTRK